MVGTYPSSVLERKRLDFQSRFPRSAKGEAVANPLDFRPTPAPPSIPDTQIRYPNLPKYDTGPAPILDDPYRYLRPDPAEVQRQQVSSGLRRVARVSRFGTRLNPYIEAFQLGGDLYGIGKTALNAIAEELARRERERAAREASRIEWYPIKLPGPPDPGGDPDFGAAGWELGGGWDQQPALGARESFTGPLELFHDGDVIGDLTRAQMASFGWTAFASFDQCTWVDDQESVYQWWPITRTAPNARNFLRTGGSAVGQLGVAGDPWGGTVPSEVTRPVPLWAFPTPSPATPGNPLTSPQNPEFLPDEESDSPWPIIDTGTFTVPGLVWPWPEKPTDPVPQPATQELTILTNDLAVWEDTKGRPRNEPPRENRDWPFRERKVRMGAALRVGWFVIGQLTEVGDLINDLYNSLPKPLRKKLYFDGVFTPTEKLAALWDHWDEVDVARAIQNYVNSQMEDFVYGVLSPDRQLNQALQSPTQKGKFVSDLQSGMYEASGESLPVPKVEFDVNSGSWSVDVAGYVVEGNLGRAVF